MSVRVEGYLYKYSSGHLARWQKRFFVLESGKLSYFKRSPGDRDVPKKAFSVRRITSVVMKEKVSTDDREFELVFTSGKTYAMRAPTHEDMRKWVSSLRGTMAYLATIPDDGPADANGELSDGDGMTSTQGSAVSESQRPPPISPQSSDHKLSSSLRGFIPRRESLSGALHAVGHGISSAAHGIGRPLGMAQQQPVADSSMLEVEIDPDQLDKHFEEWFFFIPHDSAQSGVHVVHRDVKMSHAIDACNRASAHMWTTLANLPRGSDVKQEEAIGRARARMGAPAAVDRASIVVEEYMERLVKYAMKSIDLRAAAIPHLSHGKTTLGLGHTAPMPLPPTSIVSELPGLMDCVSRIAGAVDKLFVLDSAADSKPPIADAKSSIADVKPTLNSLKLKPGCVCCYCDPSGVAMLKLERHNGGKKNLVIPPIACSQDRWKKMVRSLLQRIGGELEVGLIEEMQAVIGTADQAWTSSARLSLPTDETTFGPCPQQHPLMDDMGTKSALLTSFAPAFIQAAQSKCLNAASQWMAAYPGSARMVSEHASSALVASLNSVWRHYKRAAAETSEIAVAEAAKKYSESMRLSRDDALRSSADGLAARRNSAQGTQQMGRDLEHLVAFANECVVISRFAAKTWSNGVTAKFTPDVFLTCMDGLANGFLATASDVCHSIVAMHFYPRVRFDLTKMFNAKQLAHSVTSPMNHAVILTDQFVASIDVLAPIGCVKEGIVALLGPSLMRAYMAALIKNKPKLKTFKTVPDMLKSDVVVFKDLFAGRLRVASAQLESTLSVMEDILKLIHEKNRVNFSIHFNSTAQLLGSKKDAYIVISGVLKMREHEWNSAADKKDVTNMLASMKTLTLTEKEENDEEHEEPAKKEESVVRKAKNGAVTIALAVGDLKLGWKFEE